MVQVQSGNDGGALDPSKPVRDMLARLDMDRPYRDMVAALDPSKPVRDMLARLDMDRPYRDIVTALDPSKPVRDMLAQLDVSRSYQSLVSSWDAQSVVDLADGGRVAGPYLEALVELGAVPGTSDSLDELTQEIESFNPDADTLSEPTRYAVAIYIGLVAFALCAAFYLQHPDAAQLILDASTPATWSWMVAAAVYRGLGGPPKE